MIYSGKDVNNMCHNMNMTEELRKINSRFKVNIVCWNFNVSFCNGHIETMPARESNPFIAQMYYRKPSNNFVDGLSFYTPPSRKLGMLLVS